MEDLDYLIGTWTARAENPITGRAFSLRYTLAPALGGLWLAGKGESPEMGLEIRDFWGRDPVSGGIVRVLFDSRGTFGVVRSPGWTGDVLLLEGEARGERGLLGVRETIARLGPTQCKAVWESRTETGWKAYAVEHLTRVSEESPRYTIGRATVLVRDQDEAIAYFTRTLGFTLTEDTELPSGKRWVVVSPPRSGGTALVLARATTPEQEASVGRQAAGRVFLFLHTDDFARDFARLEAEGVDFTEGPRQEPYGTVAVFRDLYGNRWDLVGCRSREPSDPPTRREGTPRVGRTV